MRSPYPTGHTQRWILAVSWLMTHTPAYAASVANTKHNLSVSGPGHISAYSEAQVCAFCHVPHNPAAPSALWTRPDTGTFYIPYESSTLKQRIGQPDGSSRLCLSCHDGTVAIGIAGRARRRVPMMGVSLGGMLAKGNSNLGTDLRRDHPISMPIPVDNSGQLRAPPNSSIRLDAARKVQCTSCHDPHEDARDPNGGAFLVGDNTRGGICVACHVLRSWDPLPAAHQASTKLFGPEHGNHTPYRTVADTACMSCHRSHHAGFGPRLLKSAGDAVCTACHDGQVATVDITADFGKEFAHIVGQGLRSSHDAAEGPGHKNFPLPENSMVQARHVECVDCHNPHAANDRKSVPPFITGALEDLWGIDRSGGRIEPAVYEYEICFKCHADSANKPALPQSGFGTPIRRQVTESNLRIAFDPTGPSSHPVIATGKNPNVPGLLNRLAESSQIRCSDCHASDTGNGAPHGSIYAFMLEREYVTDDNAVESPETYAMCYKCHDRAVLLSDTSNFPGHRKHVVEESTPCSACHMAHGVGPALGDPSANAHLINFDLNIVRPQRGIVRYDSLGPGAGECTLMCHGKKHDPLDYP